MRVIELDKYIDHDWSTDSNFTAIMNTAMNRKFQQQGQVNINPNSNDSIEMICMSRVLNNINEYKDNNDKRTYKHRAYNYDSVNELERFGLGRYARNFNVIISFEDALDFVYSCMFKTQQGGLIKFCDENGLDYRSYSRQLLGGGKFGQLYLTDLVGFSPAFDVIINMVGSDSSIEKLLYFSRLYRFCESFRNALVVELGSALEDDMSKNTILASVGITSIMYYAEHDEGFEDIEVKYKTNKINLKTLCVRRGEYFKHIHEYLSY